MRVCVALMMFFVIASPAAAQEQPARAESRDAAGSGMAGRFSVGLDVDPLRDTLASAAQQPAPPRRPAAPARAGRRRGSMVGYIDDATVGTKLRVRFDSAFHNTVPDRAEFFYAKCGCYQDATDATVDPDAPGPRPGAVNDSNYQQLNIWGEYGVNDLLSVFGQLPVRWFQPQSFIPGSGAGFSNQSGIGDVRAGAKLALVSDDEQTLTAQAQFYMPTGDASKAMGTDHASFEPTLLYYRQLSEAATLESQFGVWIPFGGSAGVPTSVDEKFSGSVLNYGIGSGFDLYRRGATQFGPVVELIGWHVLGGFQTVPTPDPAADGINIVNIKIGARVSVADKHSVYFGYGHHLTDATWYDDILRFEYRRSF